MPLTPSQLVILNKLGAANVRPRLQYAGAGSGSAVPGISSPDPSRIDVEEWLAGKGSRSIKVASRYPLVCEGSFLGDDFGRGRWDHRDDIGGSLWEIDPR